MKKLKDLENHYRVIGKCYANSHYDIRSLVERRIRVGCLSDRLQVSETYVKITGQQYSVNGNEKVDTLLKEIRDIKSIVAETNSDLESLNSGIKKVEAENTAIVSETRK